jgi:tripartite-type tricarboxylate transporter receptor subunit TctC
MRRVIWVTLIMLCGVINFAEAQSSKEEASYPNHPIRLMSGGVGSTADYLARLIGVKLNEKWAQPGVVDSRTGAGGTITADILARATPDGYTLMVGHAGPVVSALALYKNLSYDPVRDFAPVTQLSKGVVVLVTLPSMPVKSVQELIAYIRQKKDLSYGSAGNGSISHLVGELFNTVSGVKVLHIPYKSAGFALTSLLSSETQIAFLSPVTAHTQLVAGRVKALVVSSKTRFLGLPEVPSAVEAGVPGLDAQLWFGLFTTAKTPDPVIMKLNREVSAILSNPEIKAMLLAQGAEAAPSTPQWLGQFVQSEIKRWVPIIRSAGIQAD